MYRAAIFESDVPCISLKGQAYPLNSLAMNISLNDPGNSDDQVSFAGQTSANAPQILVAEDNEVNRVLAQEILEFLGFSVQSVENGEQAVECALQQTFDLILMDCQMPLLDGFEATRQLRYRERATGYDKTPIVALSGHADSESREDCLIAGMDDYLQKPFTIKELQEMVARWLPGQGT